MSDFLHGCKDNSGSNPVESGSKSVANEFKTKKGNVVAKELDYNLGDTKKTRFLVATYLGSLYDPDGGYSNRESSLSIKLKSTNKEAYTHYLRYLQTHNKSNFIAAERNFLNGN